jgi:hypothetical protein
LQEKEKKEKEKEKRKNRAEKRASLKPGRELFTGPP